MSLWCQLICFSRPLFVRSGRPDLNPALEPPETTQRNTASSDPESRSQEASTSGHSADHPWAEPATGLSPKEYLSRRDDVMATSAAWSSRIQGLGSFVAVGFSGGGIGLWRVSERGDEMRGGGGGNKVERHEERVRVVNGKGGANSVTRGGSQVTVNALNFNLMMGVQTAHCTVQRQMRRHSVHPGLLTWRQTCLPVLVRRGHAPFKDC